MRPVLALGLSLLLTCLLAGCGNGGGTPTSRSSTPGDSSAGNSTFVFASSGGSSNAANVITTYRANRTTGQLSALASTPTGGSGTSHLTFDSARRLLFAPNSLSNTVSVLRVDPQSGTLTQAPGSPVQATDSPQSVVLHPGLAIAYVINSSGVVDVFSITSTGALTPVPGSVPRPLPQTRRAAITANGRVLFVLSGSPGALGLITTYALNATTGVLEGAVSPDTSTAGFNTQFLTLTSQSLYATDVDSNTISAFAVDAASGALTPIQGMPFPTDVGPGLLAVVGNFAYVVNSGSLDLQVFNVAASGALVLNSRIGFPTGSIAAEMAFSPATNFLFVATGALRTPGVLSVNTTNGSLGLVFSPAVASTDTIGLAVADISTP